VETPSNPYAKGVWEVLISTNGDESL